MKSNKSKIVGWALSYLIAAFLIFASAMGKFVKWEGKEQMFSQLGYSTELMFKIGIVEAALAILFVIPRAGFLGAILLTGYLGGATATHVRVGDPFLVPILTGMFVWISFGLRRPEVFALAMGSAVPMTTVSEREK